MSFKLQYYTIPKNPFANSFNSDFLAICLHPSLCIKTHLAQHLQQRALPIRDRRALIFNARRSVDRSTTPFRLAIPQTGVTFEPTRRWTFAASETFCASSETNRRWCFIPAKWSRTQRISFVAKKSGWNSEWRLGTTFFEFAVQCIAICKTLCISGAERNRYCRANGRGSVPQRCGLKKTIISHHDEPSAEGQTGKRTQS